MNLINVGTQIRLQALEKSQNLINHRPYAYSELQSRHLNPKNCTVAVKIGKSFFYLKNSPQEVKQTQQFCSLSATSSNFLSQKNIYDFCITIRFIELCLCCICHLVCTSYMQYIFFYFPINSKFKRKLKIALIFVTFALHAWQPR